MFLVANTWTHRATQLFMFSCWFLLSWSTAPTAITSPTTAATIATIATDATIATLATVATIATIATVFVGGFCVFVEIKVCEQCPGS